MIRTGIIRARRGGPGDPALSLAAPFPDHGGVQAQATASSPTWRSARPWTAAIGAVTAAPP